MKIIILIFSYLAALNAQISITGKYRDFALKSLNKSFKMDSDESMTIYNLPEQDNRDLLAQAEAKERIHSDSRLTRKNDIDGTEEIEYSHKLPKITPFTFGTAIPLNVSINYNEDIQWIVNEDTQSRMWRFKVYSKDAHSISIYFADFYLKPSSELYIIGQEVRKIIFH